MNGKRVKIRKGKEKEIGRDTVGKKRMSANVRKEKCSLSS